MLTPVSPPCPRVTVDPRSQYAYYPYWPARVHPPEVAAERKLDIPKVRTMAGEARGLGDLPQEQISVREAELWRGRGACGDYSGKSGVEAPPPPKLLMTQISQDTLPRRQMPPTRGRVITEPDVHAQWGGGSGWVWV